ncbi:MULTISPECIES: transporter substrate-binding domain-containing protein [Agrobacterium]|uniref:Transporter substrate-binding domain-containing protein n=1 Tax=Agrobacterium tumefaciens TaxID=358 RepID=A0AAE6BGE8_AGRTU|nr:MULTISPECIES: transporter substrate-binding domain-containing protein [Agrobacterium]QCL75874.1 transporter substrate-binding domain-containing protein [Agrobacterium tumefaciens]QCL81433.1 transporter substrate-binding domain-containing protein [Agrobacterium tumefaciens]CUX53571.1 Glutamate/glutamine/aspartate/asparagine-binding protein BztA [Agrobacterium sp. NCPPB 925]
MKLNKLVTAGVFAGLALTAGQASASVLDTVKQRGTLNCGTDNTAPGFGYLNTTTGRMEGLDVDFCRAVAAAVLGDASKVKFVTVTDKSRFDAVLTNQVDVVFAHTTIKPARESSIAIDFLPVNFYDGTGVMVKTDSGVHEFADLDGATFCTTQGSVTETVLTSAFKARSWTGSKVLTYENLEKLFAALNSGRCNAMSTDKSALAAWAGNSPKPSDFHILPDTLDKSPFGGFVAANDSKWRNALRWVTYGLFQAEESEITQANLDEKVKSEDPFVQKFLGVGGGYGNDFGLSDDFVMQAIKAVGNYGEVYERNLGPNTKMFLDRKGTPNALWTQGGAIYSPLWN